MDEHHPSGLTTLDNWTGRAHHPVHRAFARVGGHVLGRHLLQMRSGLLPCFAAHVSSGRLSDEQTFFAAVRHIDPSKSRPEHDWRCSIMLPADRQLT